MAVNKTSLSAGEIVRDVLIKDEEVKTRVNKVFPVVEDKATLPYIIYRRVRLEPTPTQSGGADTIGIEVLCGSSGYTEGVELAEAVRGALEGRQAEIDGLRMRSCYLLDSEESWQNDAYVQQLIFQVKI